MEIKDRIRKLMEAQHMNRQVFCDYIGLSQATLSNIFNSKTRPTLSQIDAIKKKIPSVSTDWLLYGIGPMYTDGTVDPVAEVPNANDEPMLEFKNAATALPDEGTTPVTSQRVNGTPKNAEKLNLKNADKSGRKITEIRIFYDDQTWETFVPQK